MRSCIGRKASDRFTVILLFLYYAKVDANSSQFRCSITQPHLVECAFETPFKHHVDILALEYQPKHENSAIVVKSVSRGMELAP